MKLIKKVQTTAEKAGLPSVVDKAKEIEAVLGVEKPKRTRAKKVPEAVPISEPVTAPEKKKRVLSDEQREALRERLVKAREAKANKRALKN